VHIYRPRPVTGLNLSSTASANVSTATATFSRNLGLEGIGLALVQPRGCWAVELAIPNTIGECLPLVGGEHWNGPWRSFESRTPTWPSINATSTQLSCALRMLFLHTAHDGSGMTLPPW
jgi:hypothetical protein